jgi:hypothetical protein
MDHILLDKRDERREARFRVPRAGKLDYNSQDEASSTGQWCVQGILSAPHRRGQGSATSRPNGKDFDGMEELLRTNDPVLLSYVSALLEGASIDFMVADLNMSVLEGSIGALPRRVLVDGERLSQAREILTEAGIGHVLARDHQA